MSREVPAVFRQGAEDQETSAVFLVLLTIEHELLPVPLRVVDNTEGADITSNGNLFQACPFDISLLSDADGIPTGQLTIQNVDRTIGEAIDKISTPPQITIQLILAAAPDDIAVEYSHVFLEELTVTAMQVTGRLRAPDLTTEGFPGKVATQALFPNLYR